MIKKPYYIDLSASGVEVKLMNKFIELFGENNIEILDREYVEVRPTNNRKIRTYIITFMLFGEIKFKAHINNDITDEELLDIKIKHEYSKACDTLKSLILRMDNYFKHEIM